MYLNNFRFVVVIVSVSAFYFDENAPSYLSDYILASEIPEISKKPIWSFVENGLGGNEKLSKRDITEQEKIEITDEVNRYRKNDKKIIENGEESGLVFIPSFGRRTRRSNPNNNLGGRKLIQREKSKKNQAKYGNRQISNEENSDNEIEKRKQSKLSNPENDKIECRGVTKREAIGNFNSQDQSRISDDEKNEQSETQYKKESGRAFIPPYGVRRRRSAAKKGEKDLLNLESNIVFLPSFRRNGFRRFRRYLDGTNHRYNIKTSAKTLARDNEITTTVASVTENDEELSDSDTVNGKQSDGRNIKIFLPSFGRRSLRNVEKRPPIIFSQQHETLNTGKNEKTNRKEGNVLNAAIRINGVHTSETTQTKGNKDSKKGEDDQFREESGLVFIPSFRRRLRRDKNSSNSPNYENTSITSVPSPNKNGYVQKKSFDTHASGLVFLSSFQRRIRRDISTENPKKIMNQLITTMLQSKNRD